MTKSPESHNFKNSSGETLKSRLPSSITSRTGETINTGHVNFAEDIIIRLNTREK